MQFPSLDELPPPPHGKTGWPWTESSQILPDTMHDGRPWPKISIITPSYNQGRFIEEAIRSVLLQGYPNLEYIVIDGNSTDESVDIIRKYEQWFAYWVSEPDRGQSHAINKGIKKSTGQLFNWHNCDDVLTPNCLATLAAAMFAHPDASYVHGYRIVVDAQLNILYDTKITFGDKTDRLPKLYQSVCKLKGGSQPGCLMDRSLVSKLGMLDEDLHYIMDADIILKLGLVKPPLYVPVPTVYYRVYPDTKSCQWNSRRAKERLIVAQKLFSRNDLPLPIKKLKREAFATAHRFAFRNYAEANMYHPAFLHFIQDVALASFKNWRERLVVIYNVGKKYFPIIKKRYQKYTFSE